MKRIKVKVKEGHLKNVNGIFAGHNFIEREYFTEDQVLEVLGIAETKSSKTITMFDGDEAKKIILESESEKMYLIDTKLDGKEQFFATDFDVVDWGDFKPDSEKGKEIV